MKNTTKIIALVGPTASGKTDIAIQLAKRINGEIISADSRLVYKDFNIGTAKPTEDELSTIKHHLIDVADPRDNYTVGIYKKQADKAIQEITANNKVPIITGGTGFYTKVLLEGLDMPDVEPDIEFREQMENLALSEGKEKLYENLAKIDPVIAQKLHPNDSFRIIRALEVHKATGRAMSEVQAVSEPEYNVLYAGLNSENREYLYDRINRRVDIMHESGLVNEVENLINKYGKTLSLLKTLGYKEICEYMDELYSIDEALDLIKKNTRNFAKRQLTWFRANKKINWFYIDKLSSNEICEEIIRIYNDGI